MQVEPNGGVELPNLEYFKIIPNFDDADFCRRKAERIGSMSRQRYRKSVLIN